MFLMTYYCIQLLQFLNSFNVYSYLEISPKKIYKLIGLLLAYNNSITSFLNIHLYPSTGLVCSSGTLSDFSFPWGLLNDYFVNIFHYLEISPKKRYKLIGLE